MSRALSWLLVGAAYATLATGVPAVRSQTAVEAEGATTRPSSLADLAPAVKKIEEIRGLTFKRPVASGRQTSAEFRAFVEHELDLALPRGKAACTSRALARLGLLPETYDLRRGYTNMMSAQVAAYYDPFRKTFFIVHPDLPEVLLDPTIVHELTHALQDQSFGLESRIKALRTADNEDMENAFRFLAEGEATYVMLLAALRDQGVDLDKSGDTIDSVVEGLSRTGRDALVAQLDAMKGVLGDNEGADLASLLSSPDYLFRVLYDPYSGGQAAVHAIRRAGGWPAVDALWRNPPASTELLLHPEKLLREGGRDEPVKVAVPDVSAALGPGYAPACGNTLGELETQILLEVTLPAPSSGAADERAARARTAAGGWGGDRWRAYEKAGGASVVVWKSVWDTDADAVELEQAMRAACAARMPEGRALPPASPGGIELRGTSDPTAPAFLVARLGKEVTFVAGASPVQARAVLAALHPSLAPAEGVKPAPSGASGAPASSPSSDGSPPASPALPSPKTGPATVPPPAKP